MKYLATIIFAIIIIPNINAQTISLKPFDSIEASTSVHIELVEGDRNYAEVELENTDMDNLICEVKGDELEIRFKNSNSNWGRRAPHANIKVYYTQLKAIDSSAGAKITSNYVIKSDYFDIDASSGSSVKLAFSSNNIDADVSSGASVCLTGETANEYVEVSSGGHYNGTEFKSTKTNVEVSSGGSAEVFTDGKLRAQASSGGSVEYNGNPTSTNFEAGLTGSIERY